MFTNFPDRLDRVLGKSGATGARLAADASGQHGMVQVSGLRFTYGPSQPVGGCVTSITASATGQPVDPGANYRVVTNDFMINGGDNYATFQRARTR